MRGFLLRALILCTAAAGCIQLAPQVANASLVITLRSDSSAAASRPIPVEPHQLAAAEMFVRTFESVLEEQGEEGLRPFLAGAGSLSIQGGSRPVGDFDFRVNRTPSVSNWNHAQRIITALNTAGEAIAAEYPSGEVPVFEPFHQLGRNVTIGTRNWFGIELSITVVDPAVYPDQTLIGVRDSHLRLQSVRDGFRDKLVAVVRRAQQGEDSVKKVAQDLYDLLEAMDRLSVPMSSAGIVRELDHRVGTYYYAENLETESIDPSLAHDQVRARIMDRLIRTARAHITEGPRRKFFLNLAARHRNPRTIVRLFALSTMTVPKYDPTPFGMRLNEWFDIWNKPPFKAPGSKAEIQARNLRGKASKALTTTNLDPRLLEILPVVMDKLPKPCFDDPALFRGKLSEMLREAFAKVDLTAHGETKAMDSSEKQMLYILGNCEGCFREFPDSRAWPKLTLEERTQESFSKFALAPSAVKESIRRSQKASLAEWQAKGIALTEKGKAAFSSTDWGALFVDSPSASDKN